MNTPDIRINHRLVLTVVVLAALLGGAARVGWIWAHPQAFMDAGGWGMGADNRKVGATIYAGISYPRDRDGGHVVLRGGQANIVSGAQNADVELLVCTLDPEAEFGAIGSYSGKGIYKACLSLEPLEGERLDLHYAPMRQQIVMKVTLTQRGTVNISDVTLDYNFGWQRGSQRTGGNIVMSTGSIT